MKKLLEIVAEEAAVSGVASLPAWPLIALFNNTVARRFPGLRASTCDVWLAMWLAGTLRGVFDKRHE